jgi:aryl-alcohol dehydrogenase-like predicted oxidoreductase
MIDGEPLPQRTLGSSGIAVSAIGLGCMSLSGIYGKNSDEDGIALIRFALDRGITLLDTADMYGFGHNEDLVGAAIRGRREQIVLATKFGNLGGRDGKFADGRPETVISACEASLKRLGVDTIDIYFQHRVDPSVPVEETVGAMARLIEQGKVKHLGLCEAAPERIKKAHATHPIAAVQSEYSLLYREVGEETRAVTADLGISFVAYAPLGRSLLAGAVPDFNNLAPGDTRGRHPRFEGENFQKNRALVERVEAIAADKRCTVAQLCLAWLMAQGDDVIPIPGTKSVERLQENLGALDVALTPEEAAEIGRAIPVGAAAGTRYPAGGMKGVFI